MFLLFYKIIKRIENIKKESNRFSHKKRKTKKETSNNLSLLFRFLCGERGIDKSIPSLPRASLQKRETDESFQINSSFSSVSFCGERGIRTPGTFQYNGFQDRRIRPLCHLSKTSFQKCFSLKAMQRYGFILNLQIVLEFFCSFFSFTYFCNIIHII